MAKKKSTTRKSTGGGSKANKASSASFDGGEQIILLNGAETMLHKLCMDRLMDALTKKHGDVQRVSFEGKSVTIADVLDELRTFSLMQQYKIVEVTDADLFVKEETRPALERYAENPVDAATLVFRSTSNWRPGRLDKAIAKVGRIIKCEPLNRPDAARWAVDRAKSVHRTTIDPNAAQKLVDRIGTSLTQLDSEIGKLAVLAGEGNAIDLSLIEHVTGRSSDEKVWAIQEQIIKSLESDGDAGRIVSSLHEMVDVAGYAPELVVWAITDLLRKLALAAELARQGASDRDIGKELKLWGSAAWTTPKIARRLGVRRAGQAFDAILRADARAKSGFGDLVRNLEGVSVMLADKMS